MPFFKKRKSQNLPQQQQQQSSPNVQNGTILTILPPQKVLPPMQNFIPPPDVVADALAKTNRRSSSTFLDVIIWAKEYFSAFLKNEGYIELFELWETLDSWMSKELKTATIPDDKEIKEQITTLQSRFEICSTKLSLDKVDDSLDYQTWIKLAHRIVFLMMQETCLTRYLESKLHVKCQVDLFTNGNNVSLYDILLNQNALFYFMEYAEQEGKREVLEFWLGATNFAEQFSTISVLNSFKLDNDATEIIDYKTAASDAMVLYEKYISLQAPHPLGLRDELRSEVEAKICSQEEISHCFNNAIIEAFAFLHVTCLEGFLKSSLFLSFLSDLIGSLNSSKSQQTFDSSSVGSSSSVKSFPVSSNSSLTSPTSTVRERGKLSLGRVNALGKFEADIDLDVLKTESSLARTVKRFVNFDDKEKAKEELAWQVAAMIVNEVTSVTMGPVDLN